MQFLKWSSGGFAFRGVWKQSLSELSGGQLSLLAFSLILALLLFKPATLYILEQMPRRPRYPKISNLATSEQHPHEEAPVASSIQRDDPPISSTGGGVLAATSCRPFRPPQIETVLCPQLNIADNQNQRTQDEDVKPLANEVYSFDDHVDRFFEASDAGNRRAHINAKHRLVNVIDKNFVILKS
ncbi:hypothetical protein PIB30_062700 [Stylosanthes scabra]|uniref:Uncharacterized protein n=1 Tax=Stylosanthes scabra TaxID=79078 RepID=A0ABU6QN30_9FABA|nr:hypothetical protein [Stylosanthes scabra]